MSETTRQMLSIEDANVIDRLTEQGQEAAYREQLPRVMAIPSEKILPGRGQLDLVYANAFQISRTLAAQVPMLAGAFTEEEISTVSNIPMVAAGLVRAQRRIDLLEEPARELEALLQEAWPLRRLMLAQAKAAMEAGIIPRKTYREIRAGSGQLDAAQDMGDLAEVYEEYDEPLQGRSLVTRAHIARARELSVRLRNLLKPGVAKAAPTSQDNTDLMERVEIRDRFWTQLNKDVRIAYRMAGYLWGSNVSRHMPRLFTRIVKRSRKKEGGGED